MTFPVVYSSLDISGIVTEIIPQYAIESVQSCQFWHRGLSDIYLIETENTSYILRISHYHWRKKSEIEFELQLLEFLAENNIPVAHALRNKNNHLLIEINAPEGQRYGSLFIYAPGQIPLGDLNQKQSYELGLNVAKIHQIGNKFTSKFQRKPLNLEYLLDDSLKIIAPFLKNRLEDYNYLIKTIENIKLKLETFPNNYPYWTICWGDPHSGNVHFTPENKVTLFDFDQCGYGYRIFEIAKFWQVCIRTGMTRKTREAFLEGYQSLNQLTDLEINNLQLFVKIAHIWSWAIHVETTVYYDYSRLDHNYFTQRLQKLKFLVSHEWQLF
jgi:Ser/Thr protein kinase RdoA (MazF antagonist)